MFRILLAIFTAGFALFAMFFGSGNLVFPLMVGAKTGVNFFNGALGLLLTGVIVPFLGLISIIFYHQTPRKYFDRLGKPISFIIVFIMLALLGPFGVCPRCILVAYGGLNLLFPDLSLAVFSLFFILLGCVFIYFHDYIVPFIGKYLTPILLASIICVISFGIYGSNLDTVVYTSKHAFFTGMWLGYQPMDLLAAFFFAASITNYFSHNFKHLNFVSPVRFSFFASIVGIILLGGVYYFFVKLGAIYSNEILKVEPEQMLATIAQLTLGRMALPIVVTLIFLACLTTFIILMDLFAAFLEKDILQKKASPFMSMVITSLIAFSVSLLGFGQLAEFLANILYFIYPALIVFTILSIIECILKIKIVKTGFYTTIGLIFLVNIIL